MAQAVGGFRYRVERVHCRKINPPIGRQSVSVSESLSNLLGENVDPVAAGYHLRELSEGPAGTGLAIMANLLSGPERLQTSDPAIVGALLRVIHSSTVTTLVGPDSASVECDLPNLIQELLQHLPDQATNRHLLLHLLAVDSNK